MNRMNKEIFGAFLAAARKEAGMTQKELADKLHVTDKAVSKWERALCYPDLTLMEDLAAALGLALPELMACRRTAEETAPSDDRTLAVKSALDISGDALKRQRRNFRTWLGGGVLLLVLLVVICLLSIIVTQQEQVVVSSKQSDGVDHYIYLEVYDRRENHLLRLRCPDREIYDAINLSKQYDLRFRWNRLTWQGVLLDCQEVKDSLVIGGPADLVGSRIGVDSLLGYDCVWQEYGNVTFRPEQGDWLYTYRYYCFGDGSSYSLRGPEQVTELITVRDCLATAPFDYDNDGVVELFVLTQYEEEPYLLCDVEDGRVTSRYVDNVPDEVQELLRTA